MTKKKSRRGNWSDAITDDQYRAKLRGLCEVNERGCWVPDIILRVPKRPVGA